MRKEGLHPARTTGLPVRLGVCIAVALCCAAVRPAAAQECALPSRLAGAIPDSIPTPAPYATIRDQGIPFADLQLGLGHLRPTDSTWAWDWLSKITLPLSDRPGTAPWRWIAGGWTIDAQTADVAPFAVAGLLETGYEEASFIALDTSVAGWIEIRVAPHSGRNRGTAWIPECALRGESVDLTVEPWEDRLLSDLISPLYFRSGKPHVLRDAPRLDGSRLGSISGSYHLEPQEIVGDWMRVIVKQPSDYCAMDIESTVREGWVKWQSPEKGPWVWYYSRGC